MDFESTSPQSRTRKSCEHYSELCALFTTQLTEQEQGELIRICSAANRVRSFCSSIARSQRQAPPCSRHRSPTAPGPKPWSIETPGPAIEPH